IVVIVDVLQIIELLQNKMAWIIQNIATLMLFCRFPEPFKCYAIVKVLARVNFVTQVDPVLVEGIQDWSPAFCKLFESILDETGRALRPWINRLPHQGT